DETLVVLDSNKEYRAHPFPTWSDYLMKRASNTWDVQYSVPVSAIFFLERADNDEVTRLTASEASVLMMESASQVCVHTKTLYRQQPDLAEFRKKLFNNACNLAIYINLKKPSLIESSRAKKLIEPLPLLVSISRLR
ncbi:MAG: hypothetical protein AAB116_25000, partial [Candidatus Poribacteria bacterium]